MFSKSAEKSKYEKGEIEQRHAIDRADVIDATSDVKISDINNEMEKIK